jgi:hypothetical protein
LFPGTRCMVPQPFTAGGNRSYPEFWAITGGPHYPGYITLIVAPEPFVERVAETSTHIVLWALPRDSMARLWGESLNDLDGESRGGAHRVAPEATSEVKAQAEAKFHMY